MITKKKKNKNKNSYHFKLFSILLGFLALFIIGFLVFSNINIGLRRAELTARIEGLRKEIQVLEEKNQKLQNKINRADGKDFLEQKAREDLGLKKPGEEVVIISPFPKEEKPIKPEEKSFWQRIWEKLDL